MKKTVIIKNIATVMAAINLTAVNAEEANFAENLVPFAVEKEAPLFPLPFTPDYTRGSGWGFALGLGVEYGSAYSGSDEYEFGLEPTAAIQWRTGNHLFTWEGLELSWTTRQQDQWYFQVDMGFGGEREAGDSDDGRLNGLDARDDVFTGTGEVRYAFDSEWRNYIGTRITLGDSDFGTNGFFFFGHRFGSRQDGGGTEAFLYTTIADSKNLNRDFGVSATESIASGLAASDLSNGLRSFGLRLVDRRFISENIQFVSALEYEYFSGDVKDSPITRENSALELELSLIYQF